MIITHGKLVAFGEPEKLMHDLLTPNEITITAEAEKPKVEEILAGLSGITEAVYPEHQEEGTVTVRIKTDMKEIYDMSRQLFKAFVDANVVLLEMALKQVNLEDVFIELTDDNEVSEPTEEPVTESEESEVEADDSSIEA